MVLTLKKILQQERVRRVIEVVGIGVGISGISLSHLFSTQPFLFYFLLIALITLLFSLLFTWKKINIFTNKDEINQIWQQLLAGSYGAVEAFAGDVSWIKRDKNKIQEITKEGIKFSVLCHNPFQNRHVQANIIALFEANVKVKFFDKNKFSPPYGLLIDGDNPVIGTALIIDREPKPNIPNNREGLRNVDIYNYRAVRYVPKTDDKHIKTISTLFKAMWEEAREGVVLMPVDVQHLIHYELVHLLRLVKHYSHITEADVSAETIHIGQIFSATNYVKMSSLRRIDPVCYAYRDQNISEYKPVYCWTNKKRKLLLPPILEVHDDKLVVVDGTHRLFHQYAERQNTGAFCIVIKNVPDLPGEPISFRNVRAWPRNLLFRDEAFVNYDDSLYRNFIPLEEQLENGNYANGKWQAHSSNTE